MNFGRRADREPEVNLTPLIDVVFLLLIFFMVSTTFDRETEVRVELPQASGAALEAEEQPVEVTVDEQGRFYVNGRELVNSQLATLKRAMEEAAGGRTDPQVILSADRRTPHGAVVTAMDAAGQLGFVNITIATSRPADGAE